MIKRISILCLKILTSVTLLMVVFEDVQFNVVFDEFNNMNLRVVSLIFSLMFLQLLIASLRWFKILNYLNITLSYKKCAAYTWAGMFFSQALPSSLGGDAYKIFQIKTLGHSYKGAFCSVVSDRLFGLIGVITLILMFPFAALAAGHQKILGFEIKFLMYAALACMLLYFFFVKALKNFQNSYHFSKVYQLFDRLLLFKAPLKTLNSHFIFFNTLNYNINFFSYSSPIFYRDTPCFVHYFNTHDDPGNDFANFTSRLGCEGGFFCLYVWAIWSS